MLAVQRQVELTVKRRRKTPREAVADLLMDFGFAVCADEITVLEGAWRHITFDCLDRWRLYCSKDGKQVEITGLDTLTACRNGIEVVPNYANSGVYGDYVASAKPKQKELAKAPSV